MNTHGLLKCASAVVALVMVSACASGSAVAPPATAFSTTYVGKTLFVNGRPVTAARLNPSPRYAELVPDKSMGRRLSGIPGGFQRAGSRNTAFQRS
jgi:hypothetical protein